MDGLQFANGVVLSPDESYLLVAETGAYRITRLWLGGARAAIWTAGPISTRWPRPPTTC